MRRAFTLLELLVACILFGMLMTILTMLFNQSSIAWRTGIAGVTRLDSVRSTVGQVRNEADNAYIWRDGNDRVKAITSIWKRQVTGAKGSARLRTRAISIDPDVQDNERIVRLRGCIDDTDTARAGTMVTTVSLPCGTGSNNEETGAGKTYSVNVRCAGPDGKPNTYDDIWSFPDDFDL